jgi:ketosteroid isomerase-like protein
MTVAEVNAVAQAFHDGFANQDAAALASLYHDDARFLPPNMEPGRGPASHPGSHAAAVRYGRPLGGH